MSAIDEAREYLSAPNRVYSSGETKAIVGALLAEVERLGRNYREACREIDGNARSAADEARWKERQGEDYGSY